MLLDTLTYLRLKLKSLNLKEHSDVFDQANIPETVLDKTFALNLLEGAEVSHNQQSFHYIHPVEVLIFLKGYRNTQDTRNQGLGLGDSVLRSVMNIYDNNTTKVKNVVLNSFTISPLSGSNNNDMFLRFSFNIRLDFDFFSQC